MALNKANTSIWVKILIIILIIAFVSLFMYTGIAGLFDLFKPTSTASAPSTTVDSVKAIQQQYQPSIDAYKTAGRERPDELHGPTESGQHVLRSGLRSCLRPHPARAS